MRQANEDSEIMIDGPRLAPACGGPAKSLVIFLHGYGADGNDLIAIGRQWAGELPDTAFAAPHAPEACSMAPTGRQWFALTLRDPALRDLGEYARGVAAARPELDAFFDAEMALHGVDEASTALVGFSQGTMMALHAGLLRDKPFAGLLGYSGLLADPDAIKAGPSQKPPILLIHGDRDDMIPVAALFAATEGLSAADIPLAWHISKGIGHGIAPDGLELGIDFLKRVLR
jgi:phospholipase/carboxylesterase